MSRIYLLVEGQTEEAFVRELLLPHYSRLGIYLVPIIARTSPGHKGGIVSYAKVKPQLLKLCKHDRGAWVSTFFDLYALPNDFPGKQDAEYPYRGDGRTQAEFLEQKIKGDIGQSNFIPYLMVHEFEALLFVRPERFSTWVNDQSVVAKLDRIASSHSSPEDIDNGPATAPSKRIMNVMPEYQKTSHGPLIASDIGLDAMRQSCIHFRSWLEVLEKFGSRESTFGEFC